MRPATTHTVLSAEDCLTLGGHFYSLQTMESTYEALLVEHHLGFLVTNTHHTDAPILLFMLIEKLASAAIRDPIAFVQGEQKPLCDGRSSLNRS